MCPKTKRAEKQPGMPTFPDFMAASRHLPPQLLALRCYQHTAQASMFLLRGEI